MEKMKPRKRIIDNTSVPLSRRSARQVPINFVGKTEYRQFYELGNGDKRHHDVTWVTRDDAHDISHRDNSIDTAIKYRRGVANNDVVLHVLDEERGFNIPALLSCYRKPGQLTPCQLRTNPSATRTALGYNNVTSDMHRFLTNATIDENYVNEQSKQISVFVDENTIEDKREYLFKDRLIKAVYHANERQDYENAAGDVLEFKPRVENGLDETVGKHLLDPFSHSRGVYNVTHQHTPSFRSELFDFVNDDDPTEDNQDENAYCDRTAIHDAYSNMTDKPEGSHRLLSVEEKWQIIFNEKSRAPIYAVGQYIDYLKQFVDGNHVTYSQIHDVTKKDGINPVTYLLRKLKLDLKMAYDSFLEEFLQPENKGLELLIKLLKSIQNTGSQQSGSTNMSQLKNYKKTLTDEHDCLLCIKFSLRIKSALLKLLEIPYGLETVSMGLLSTFTKSRGTAIEILTVMLSEADGFSRTLECFTFIRLKIGEPVRFKSLMNMMNMGSPQNIIFKVSSLKFLNSLIDCSPNSNHRVFLQHELECAGLDVDLMKTNVEDRTGLEYDDLRHELHQWERKYINVDDVIRHDVTPPQHQQHIIEDLKIKVEDLSKKNAYLERQLNAVSTELRNRYEEIQRRIVPTQDACVQCGPSNKPMKSVGCQCTKYDEFGNPLKTAALYFGWQDAVTNDVMNCHDYRINLEGQGQEEEESETDHVIKVEDWLRTRCDSPDLDTNIETAGVNIETRQYFRRQYSIRHKSKKTDFPGNWQLGNKHVNHTRFPSRLERHQCHTTDCDRCRMSTSQYDSKNKLVSPSVQKMPGCLIPGVLSSHESNIQLESQSSDSAIGGSGDRLWNAKGQPFQHVPTAKSEEERLQDLITPDDSASACPEVEPFPDYSSVTTRLDNPHNYEAELSEVLREFEGHLSRYDTSPAFPSVSRSPEQVV